MLDSPSRTWGLALIGVDYRHSLVGHRSALLGVRIRAYLKRQSFHLWQAVTVLTMLKGDRAVACSPARDRGRLAPRNKRANHFAFPSRSRFRGLGR
jgi:hypothetical protein